MKRFKATADFPVGAHRIIWVRADDMAHAAYFLWSEWSDVLQGCISLFIEEVP